MNLQPVKGTRDLLPAEWSKFLFIRNQFERMGDLYRFQNLELPTFEYTPVFARGVGDGTDIVNKEMYTFEDRGGDSITLRPEGTAQLARAILTANLQRELPQRLLYFGPMFRYERPQKGRYRQFYQVGAEWVGAENAESDIEVLAFAADFLKSLELKTPLRLEINSLGDEETRGKYRQALTDYFERHRTSLSPESQERLLKNPLRILDSKQKEDQPFLGEAPSLSAYLSPDAQATFDQVLEGLTLLGHRFEINPRLVRGLDYYSHTIFEFVTDHLGAQNAVLSGGRYDGLFAALGGSRVPSIGWASGVDRLALLLEREMNERRGVGVLSLTDSDRGHALKIAQRLRQAGHATECLLSGQLGKRFKKADKHGLSHVFVVGGDEWARGEVVLKNLRTGAQRSLLLNQIDTIHLGEEGT